MCVQPSPNIPVPSSRARWNTIWHFALSVNGHQAYDGELGELEAITRKYWDQSRTLPGDIDELRYALFFLQRSFRWNEKTPVDEDATYVRAIVAQIAHLNGGVVSGPHELEEQERRFALHEAGFIDMSDDIHQL